MSDWQKLTGLMRSAHEAGRPVEFWLRDDDAVEPSDALQRIIVLAARSQAPITLAVIPENVTPALGAYMGAAQIASVVQHGFRHANNAAEVEKKIELGGSLSAEAAADQLLSGRYLLQQAVPAERLNPFVLVPPWNRLSPEIEALLPALDYTVLSGMTPPGKSAQNTKPNADLIRCDVMIDPIDWRGTRSLKDEAIVLEELCKAVEAFVAGPPPASRLFRSPPIGILTHHLAHDRAIWQFLERLCLVLTRNGAKWLSLKEVIARNTPSLEREELIRPGEAGQATSSEGNLSE